MKASKWSEVTREERFFVSILFHDLLLKPEPFMELIKNKLKLSPNISINDVGYEVCFFRDAFHAKPKLINERHKELEKQTFDLVLWLSDQSMVIIEAKAQQSFDTNQIEVLKESKKIMQRLSSLVCPMNPIYVVGLCSSKYNLKKSTRDHFKDIILWAEVADCYPGDWSDYYERADKIYRD
jgi:polyribonucleotide nucleotidyltransferase